MSKDTPAQLAFNRGMISKLALARVDLKRMALSAEIQTNWMPRVLGSMMLRPGLEHLGSTKDNAAAVHLPFIFSLSDTAIVELTADVMRVRVDDTIITRPAVTAAIINGLFTSDISDWNDHDESGATSSWLSGYMLLRGTGTKYAKRDQHITINEQSTEHALHILVEDGPVEIKLGESEFSDEYISTTLGTGEHSLAFTPEVATVYLTLRSREAYSVLVDSVVIESAGDMEVGTPWGAGDLANIRYDQSGDIIFDACKDVKQYKIERRATRSWSVVEYNALDGPFRIINTGTTTITPSALTGNITLTASSDLFESGHIGALFSIESTGQEVSDLISAEDTWTDPILIQGVESTRIFTIIIADRTDSTITLQRSVEELGSWEDVTDYTADTTVSYDDTLDNQLVYYRIGVKTGDYGTDTLDLTLRYPSGSITGIAKITSVVSGTEANARVVKAFGGTDPSNDWSEGEWSTKRGFPTSVAFNESRLFWAGKDKIIGSITDAFNNFDDTTVGDSGTINRSIGSGPVDNINWLVSGKTFLLGGDAAVKTARSSSLEEPLTPSNFNLKDVATQGTAAVAAVKVDTDTIFVHASGTRAYEVAFDGIQHDTLDVTSIVPEIGEPSIIKIVVQRQPDTRLHFIRSDGKVAILIYDKVEDVKCWILFETDGAVEDAVILPGTIEDSVYYLINRTVDSNTVRYLEKWTHESKGKGLTDTRLADSHFIYSGASTDTITGLDHLEGESVIVWGNNKDLGTYIVAGGSITLSEAVTWCCVGLVYAATFKSAKPALALATGTSLLQKKIISQIGVILADTHYQGLQYGPDENNLDNLPLTKDEADTAADTVHTEYDEEPFPFPGTWDTDSRLFLRATAPKSCTILAAVINWDTHGKS
jgi:hypothetical protein